MKSDIASDNIIHILVDASASMGEMGKLPLAKKTAAAIKRFAGDLKDVWSLGANVQVWRFSDILASPFGKSTQAEGSACLSSLEKWLMERREEGAKVLLLSDGLFANVESLEKLAALLKDSPRLCIVTVGVGADRDMRTLALLSSDGKAWDLCDVEAALTQLTASSTNNKGGLEEALAEFRSDDEIE